MSRWSEEFAKHPLQANVRQLIDLANSIKAKGLDANCRDERRRLIHGLSLIRNILTNMDSEIFPVNEMNLINDHLNNTQITHLLNSFKTDFNIGHLQNANQNITNIASTLYFVSGAIKPAKNQKTMDAEYDKFCKTISENEAEISSVLEKNKGRLDEINNLFEQTKSHVSQKTKSFINNVESMNVEAKDNIQKIRNFHDIVVAEGLAGGFKENADKEKSMADTWRKLSFFFYLLLIAWLGWTALAGGVQDFDFNWSAFFKASPLSAAIFIVAQFAIRQSNVHRKNESRSRQLFLETQAFHSFISKLPEPKKQLLTEQFARHIFGQNHDVKENSKSLWDLMRPKKEAKDWHNPNPPNVA